MPSHNPEKKAFPVKDGARCRCPYCGGGFDWPPDGMRCPSCAKTIRPPSGYAPRGKEERRKSVSQIREKHARQLDKLGPAPSFKPSKNPAVMFGVLAALAAMGGAMLALSTRRAAERVKFDPAGFTRREIATYAAAFEHYKLDIGSYPSVDDGGLGALLDDPGEPEWRGPYISTVHTDGWNMPYYYARTNGAPVLYSAGPDKRFGTADDIEAEPGAFAPHPAFKAKDPARKRARPNAPARIGQ